MTLDVEQLDQVLLVGAAVLLLSILAVRVSVGGRTFTIEDASMGDLLSLVDEAEGLISG